MTVYVDNMRAKVGRMIMCHMLADSDEELHAMADKIGVARHWHQQAATEQSHYDICLQKRAIAIECGAVEITMRDAVAIVQRKRLSLSKNMLTN